MKKVLSLVAVLMITAISFGQSGVKFTDANADYDKTATTSFNFLFGPDIKSEDISSTAAYYESYFTVEIEGVEAGNKVNITLVEDNEMARRVILRLFVSLEVMNITVGDKKIDRNDFYDEIYLARLDSDNKTIDLINPVLVSETGFF